MVDFKRHQKDSANGQCGQAVKVEPFEVVPLVWDDASGAAGVGTNGAIFPTFFVLKMTICLDGKSMTPYQGGCSLLFLPATPFSCGSLKVLKVRCTE